MKVAVQAETPMATTGKSPVVSNGIIGPDTVAYVLKYPK